MNRVTIINLAGRAYHVDEVGASAVEAWLADARTALVDDPDRDELVADFERAIAERFETIAPEPRDVVSQDAARSVIEALGTVRPVAGDAAPHHASSEKEESSTAETAPIPVVGTDSTDEEWRKRRLYRIDDDSAILAGVCSGIAAWLRWDVTVVRLIAVLLGLISLGTAVIFYILLAVILPEADTPEERAAAHGHGLTAEEMIDRARANAGPAFEKLGALVREIFRITLIVLRIVFLALAVVVIVAWAIQVALIFINGGGLDGAFDAGTERWIIAMWVSTAAWLVAGVAFALARACDQSDRPARRRSRTVISGTAWMASIIVAAVLFVVVPIATSQHVRDLEEGWTRIELYGQSFCVITDRERAGGSRFDDVEEIVDERCKRGDHVIVELAEDEYDDWDEYREHR